MSGEHDRVEATFTFAQLPDVVLYSEASDKAIRLFALLHKYSTLPDGAVPSRTRLAEEMRCSTDALDRALNDLRNRDYVQVVHRWRVGGEVVEADQRPAPNAARTSSRYVLMPGWVAASAPPPSPHQRPHPTRANAERGSRANAAGSEIDSEREELESSSSSAAPFAGSAAAGKTTTPTASPPASEPDPEGVLADAYHQFRGSRPMGSELAAEIRELQDAHPLCMTQHVHEAGVALLERGGEVGNRWAWLLTTVRDRAGTCWAASRQQEHVSEQAKYEAIERYEFNQTLFVGEAEDALWEASGTPSVNDDAWGDLMDSSFQNFASDFFDEHEHCAEQHLREADISEAEEAMADGDAARAWAALKGALLLEAFKYDCAQRTWQSVEIALREREGSEVRKAEAGVSASLVPIPSQNRRADRDQEWFINPRAAKRQHEQAIRNVERGGLGVTPTTELWAEHVPQCGCPPSPDDVRALVEAKERTRAEAVAPGELWESSRASA